MEELIRLILDETIEWGTQKEQIISNYDQELLQETFKNWHILKDLSPWTKEDSVILVKLIDLSGYPEFLFSWIAERVMNNGCPSELIKAVLHSEHEKFNGNIITAVTANPSGRDFF